MAVDVLVHLVFENHFPGRAIRFGDLNMIDGIKSARVIEDPHADPVEGPLAYRVDRKPDAADESPVVDLAWDVKFGRIPDSGGGQLRPLGEQLKLDRVVVETEGRDFVAQFAKVRILEVLLLVVAEAREELCMARVFRGSGSLEVEGDLAPGGHGEGGQHDCHAGEKQVWGGSCEVHGVVFPGGWCSLEHRGWPDHQLRLSMTLQRYDSRKVLPNKKLRDCDLARFAQTVEACRFAQLNALAISERCCGILRPIPGGLGSGGESHRVRLLDWGIPLARHAGRVLGRFGRSVCSDEARWPTQVLMSPFFRMMFPYLAVSPVMTTAKASLVRS